MDDRSSISRGPRGPFAGVAGSRLGVRRALGLAECATPTRRDRDGAVAVAIHDVEPATYTRAALIRDWLDDHGIDRVTLLVVPAPDLHPFSTSSPGLAEWLLERADRGDAIAQHGLTCRRPEFTRLAHDEARRAVDPGRWLPAGREPLAPAVRLSPLALRAGALLGGPLLRIDLRPTDLDHTRHMLALERVLRRARRRTAVTYDELAAAWLQCTEGDPTSATLTTAEGAGCAPSDPS